MKNTKRIFTAALSALLALSLTACSGGTQQGSSAADASGSSSSGSVLKVGASPSPHAEILESVKDDLAAQGITLEIVEFTDYVVPNTALDSGDLDANFFQHQPYLDTFNANNGTDLSAVAKIHFEPMGIYAGKSSDLANIPDGASIAIPNDVTNEARALQLLAAQGIIKLAEGVGLEATPIDIVENPKNITFTELEAAQLPRNLSEFDFAVINGNYAIEGGILDKVLVNEASDSDAAKEFGNIVAVRTGDESREDIQALVSALTSDKTREFIQTQYADKFVPVF